jgi:serine/threonine-protein kinase
VALEKGTTLAGYEITGILGQGGMGVVYEATQISLNRTVALKVLAPHLSEDIHFRERFRREGQIQAGIDHQNIVTVYEAGETEHGFFIAMRLIRGPNLKDMIVSRELDPGRTLRILSAIAQALDSAHEAGLIHRDIKPQNILVGGRDHPFLADFGLTKASGEKSLTRTGQFVGTFDYISPEQIKGDRATKQSDVYALAAVLYECLTGVVPFPKDSEAAVLYAQMTDPPPKVTEQRPELPLPLDQVIAKGMAKDPAERYESAGQLLLDTNRTFTRRMRAAFTPPRPIEAPQETGIRPAEADVSTREAMAKDLDPPTERAALEAETVSPVEPGLTVPAAEPAAAAPAPPETAPAETAPPETAPAETAPGTEPPAGIPPQTAPGETVIGSELPATAGPQTAPGQTAPSSEPPGPPPETAPGETPAAEPPPEEHPPREPRPGETPATAVLNEPDATRPARVEAGPTRLGGVGATVPGAGPAAAGAAAGAAPPAAPPARRERAGRGRVQPPVAAAAGLLLVAIAVAGFFVGRSGGGSDEQTTSAASNTRAVGDLEVNYPDGWRRVASPPEIPGLPLGARQEQISLSQADRPQRDALTAGFTGAAGPALLPSAFLHRLGEAPPRDDAVKLGDLEAYRYRNLRPDGFEGRLTVYVAPTTRGVLTVTCTASAGDAGTFLPACEQVAGGVNLVGGDPFPLGADEDYLDKLDDAISRLNTARRQDVAKLRAAKQRAGQARAASAVAADYRRAARSLRSLSVSPAVLDASGAVNRALAGTAGAYTRLAAAARKGRGTAYSDARRDIAAGDAALERALRQVAEAS